LVKGSIPEVHELTEEGEIRNLPSDERSSDAEFITALTYQSNGTLEPEFYIPGSSIKGVLRTRAEKIIRTLNFYRDYTTLEEAEANADTYPDRITACAITHANDDDSNLEACFGEPEKQKQASKKLPYQLYEGSCVTCRLFGNAMMRGRLTCSEAVTVQNLTPKLFDHVAIDRFTGGAADAKKFDTRPLMPVTNASTLTNDQAFTFKIHLERPELWMIGLLGHLLKDLNSGDIRIGHATRRGYGRVRGFITDAKLLALPGTKLLQACSEAKLPTRTFGAYGPYKEIILSDWLNLFSHTPWGAAGPVDRDTSGAGLLAIADEEFQKLVKEAEDQHWRMT
jgi:CRISPR/Cas system CSM-associated protein Csm3 (group 7 of RAMP superfamily)